MKRLRNLTKHSPDKSVYLFGRACSGFTIVELVIALFVSLMIMATVLSIYITQMRRYTAHDDLAGIQQNLRGALLLLPLEIRLAGCDPAEFHQAGITQATATRFGFSRDISGGAVNPNEADGNVLGANERIAYGFKVGVDANNDGIIDNGGSNWSGTGDLGRDIGSGMQPLAENIEAIEFNYFLSDGSTSLAPTNLNDIRQVQISLLARASTPTANYTNSRTYTTGSGTIWDPPDDNFKRRLIVTNIQLRNMGY